MASRLTGIHHVTALAGHPTENHDFYTRVLGQRLVKKTVNFDDPLTYHLYFGDAHGTPGTLLTHFPDPRVKRGEHGTPELMETVLGVPTGSISYWSDRLRERNVTAKVRKRNGVVDLAFEDPHGMRFALLESAGADGYAGHDVDPRHAITNVVGIVTHVADIETTARFLEDVLQFEPGPLGPDRQRLHVGGAWIDLVASEHDPPSRIGAGTVHHVAWRVPDDATQADVAGRVRAAGISVTPVMDRQYFRSVYFRIPGGVIFEVATDGPGFAVDETPESLGRALRLPDQHEPLRAEIEAHLVPLTTDGMADARAH